MAKRGVNVGKAAELVDMGTSANQRINTSANQRMANRRSGRTSERPRSFDCLSSVGRPWSVVRRRSSQPPQMEPAIYIDYLAC